MQDSFFGRLRSGAARTFRRPLAQGAAWALAALLGLAPAHEAAAAKQASQDKPSRASSSAKSKASTASAAPRKATASAKRSTRTATASANSRNRTVAVRTSKGVRATSTAPRREYAVAKATPQPARVSIGQAIGLHRVDDPLDLHSSVALVMDQSSGDVVFEKNSKAVLPIASITKLMTAMVVLDSGLPLHEMLEVSEADIDTEKHTGSRLRPGTRLSRGEMMNLALMSSENRAANALGRHYPGGLQAFVAAMNAKALAIGMSDSRFVEPTGLSSSNVSTAHDLARMVRAAFDYPLIRQYSTAPGLVVDTGYRQVSYRNTNRLIENPRWDIGLQKTGYISEAGNCLVMQATVEGRPMVFVMLDAPGKLSRFGDAQRLRQWIERNDGQFEPIRKVSDSRPVQPST